MSQTPDKEKYNEPARVNNEYAYQEILTLNNTVTLAETTTFPAIIKVPEFCGNLAKSSFSGDITTVLGAIGYTYILTHPMFYLTNMKITDGRGAVLLDMENLNLYTHTVTPKQTQLTEFLTNDPCTGIFPCDGLTTTNPVTTTTANTVSSNNYTEQKYSYISESKTAQTVHFNHKLGYIKNTICDLDKTLFYAGGLTIKLTFDRYNKYSADATAATDVVAGYAVIATSLANFRFNLCEEKNPHIIAMCMDNVAKGWKIPYSDVTLYTTAKTTTKQISSTVIDPNEFARVRRIYTSLFVATDTAINLAFDNFNSNKVTAKEKVTSYRTFINSKGIQDVALVTGSLKNCGTDWNFLSPYMKGTMTQNSYQFASNWAHFDDFCGNKPEDVDNYMNGLQLTAPMTYTFEATTANATYTHLVAVVGTKYLTFTPQGVISSTN